LYRFGLATQMLDILLFFPRFFFLLHLRRVNDYPIQRRPSLQFFRLRRADWRGVRPRLIFFLSGARSGGSLSPIYVSCDSSLSTPSLLFLSTHSRWSKQIGPLFHPHSRFPFFPLDSRYDGVCVMSQRFSFFRFP